LALEPPCPDGGATDGGGTDGGASDLPDIDKDQPCTITEVTGSHFGSSGTECLCSFESDDPTDDYVIQGIYFGGPTHTAGIPSSLAAQMPWHSGIETSTGQGATTGTAWYALSWNAGYDEFAGDGSIQGTWKVWMRPFTAGAVPINCDDLNADGLYLRVESASTFDGAPPPMPVNPLDVAEDDLACTGSTPHTTTFRLVDFPGTKQLVPIGIAGERQYTLAKMDSVSVTSWNGADRLRIIGAEGATVTLTPSSSSATLSGGDYWLGTARWDAGRLDSTGTWTNPTVSVTHSCPAGTGSTTLSVDQAYAVTLETLDNVIDTSTSGAGLVDVMLGATETDWPVYVARVHPIGGGPLSTGETHVLSLEVQGTPARTFIPITQTSVGHWSVSYSATGWSVEGTVQRVPNELVVHLTGGAVGPLELQAVTVALPEYPDDGQ